MSIEQLDSKAQIRVAICYYGIPRSLKLTYRSIEEQVVKPFNEVGIVTQYAHFYRQFRVESRTTGESIDVNPDDYRLLDLDYVKLEEPDPVPCRNLFESAKPFGDAWGDQFNSLRNLCRQLHSLNVVTEAALSEKPDVIVFCRPDLTYLDSLGKVAKYIAKNRREGIFLPYWQKFDGLNDRFAIAVGSHSACAYGCRARKAIEYCSRTNMPLHSERLVAFALEGCNVKQVGLRAVRTRADGRHVNENFDRKFVIQVHEWLNENIKTVPLNRSARLLLRLGIAAIDGRRYSGLPKSNYADKRYEGGCSTERK